MSFFDAVYDEGGYLKASSGWIHPSRTVDFNEIIYVTRGTVKIFENDRKFELHRGDCVVLEHGRRHGGYECSEKESQFYWIQFFSDYDGFGKLKHASFGANSSFTVLAELLMRTVNSPSDYHNAADCIVRLMLNEISVSCGKARLSSYPMCDTVAEWIVKNSSRKIDVREISEFFGYNKDYISRAFRKSFGLGLKEYIDCERMKYIKGLLLTTEYPLKQISIMCGFTEYKSFIKFFSYHCGEAPGEFRKKYFEIS